MAYVRLEELSHCNLSRKCRTWCANVFPGGVNTNMVRKVSSEIEDYGYLYTREMLEMFNLLKGKKLLSYDFDGGGGRCLMLDARQIINSFKFEGFDFCVRHIESSFAPPSCRFQEISVVYDEERDSGSKSEDEAEICEIVEDIILELDKFHGKQKEVANVIFKLKDKFFTPNLHIDCYNVYGTLWFENSESEKRYHPSLEEYKTYAIDGYARIAKECRYLIEDIYELDNEPGFRTFWERMKMVFVIKIFQTASRVLSYIYGIKRVFRKVGYNPEFVTLQSYLESHPV